MDQLHRNNPGGFAVVPKQMSSTRVKWRYQFGTFKLDITNSDLKIK